MPRKKGDLLKKQQSQIRLIATRLMQISLLVDDYLYQQKPMTSKSAGTYIKEISGYKERCYHDVRSLQVIEKLTRCLKGIIHEQQEITDNCFEDMVFPSSQNTSEAMPSPVYSTVDEDLTQCLEIDDIIQIQDNGHNHAQINDSSHDFNKEINESNASGTYMVIGIDKTDKVTENSYEITQTGLNQQDAVYDVTNLCDDGNDEPNNTNAGIDITKHVAENLIHVTHTEKIPQHLEVINLCDDEIKDIVNQSNRNLEPDFNIQNGISYLSIKDVDEDIASLSQDCSQSILNSYCPTELVKDKTGQLTIDYVERTTPKEQLISAKEKPTDKITRIGLPITIHANEQKINLHKKMPIQNIDGKVPEIINTEDTKPAAKKRKPNSTITKEKPEQNKPQPGKRQAKTHKAKGSMKPPTQDIQCQNSSQPDISVHNKPLSKAPVTKPRVTNTRKKTKDIPIYERTIVNDLSWIESIRFVREIQKEEYSLFAEDQTFWENYTLPSQWSETDFNY